MTKPLEPTRFDSARFVMIMMTRRSARTGGPINASSSSFQSKLLLLLLILYPPPPPPPRCEGCVVPTWSVAALGSSMGPTPHSPGLGSIESIGGFE